MKTLDIQLPDKVVTAVPVTRDKLPALEKRMIALQSIWIAHEFSTGDAIADDAAWQLMGEVFSVLPRQDNPQAPVGQDVLTALSNDYEQLEQLFFGDAVNAYSGNVGEFNLKAFKGCALWELHKVDARKKLLAADAYRREKSQIERSPQQTSHSPQAETVPATPLQT